MRDDAYFDLESGEVAELAALVDRSLDPGDVPLAMRIEKNVPLYDIREHTLTNAAQRKSLMAEWAWVLRDGSGVLVLKGALTDLGLVDRVTAIFEDIIARERAADGGADHFAAAGANDRVWNALQKLCLADPEAFALYHGAPAIDAVCEAWLGPYYQMTAQVNLVRPGGAAQSPHRDYHLGFQTAEDAARFPAHVHTLSAVMTLQGAVAHCDMPIESGPTMLLPFSQLFRPGYMAYRRADVAAFFEAKAVQLPLEKGDAVFFNPALFHAAGANRTTDTQRMANLLQVSSAFGRAMENVDRAAMCKSLYPAVVSLRAANRLDTASETAAIAAAAEGYAFPTNLDTDPPVGGLAPETQAALVHRALAKGMSAQDFATALAVHTARRQP